MRTLHYSSLSITGFAGIRERVLVSDRGYFSHAVDDEVFDGIGDNVYLAHAYFLANGATGMHYHDHVDIVSIFTKGCIEHQGSLGNGEQFQPGQVLVQCSGPDGFRHNEQNALADISGMVQLWCRPSEQSAQRQQHQVIEVSSVGMHRIYGGLEQDTSTSIVSSTQLDILNMSESQSLQLKGRARLYVFDGEVLATEDDQRQLLKRGTLVDGHGLFLESTQDCKVLILRVHQSNTCSN